MQRLDLERVLGTAAPIIGMVHLPPLPGTPGHGGMAAVLRAARRDAELLAQGGVDAVLVENYGDAPFHPGAVPPEVVAALGVAVAEVRRAIDLPVGVNVLRNDARAALAVAAATGASFIRVNVHTGAMLTDQGWITGAAHETVRVRALLAPAVVILADVLVKHAVAPPGMDAAAAAQDTWERGRADALIVTGAATGAAAQPARLRAVRDAVPDAPLLVGSGVTEASARQLLDLAAGAIIGSAFMTGGLAGAGVDPDRVARVMAALRGRRD
jgi:uncharacterized protein